jgi:K+-transporting ATPase ATPase C chain
MKNIFKDLKLNFIMLLLFGFLFPLVIWGIGLFFPAQANGLPVYRKGALVGYENIGQNFYSKKYFWGRPSAVNYDASAAAGSNKGPTNEEYLEEVKKRTDYFLKNNPGVKKSDIPSELVTASGSGLDPDISPQAAYIQARRIAVQRKLHESIINRIIKQHIEPPLLGFLGPEKVNVFKLNLALDEIRK